MSGPTPKAKSTVPTPTGPPSRKPITSTVPSIMPYRPACPAHEARHQPVAGPRAEVGCDVEAGREREEDQADEEGASSRPDRRHGRNQGECEISTRSDQQSVDHGAQPQPLTKRDPQQQHDCGDEIGHETEADAARAGHPDRQHVPRGHSDSSADHQRQGDAVQEEADDELKQPLGEIATARHDDRQEDLRQGGSDARGRHTAILVRVPRGIRGPLDGKWPGEFSPLFGMMDA